MHWRSNVLAGLGIFVCYLVVPAGAHDTPVQLPAPESAGEAWNVIEQSKANVDQLLAANLMREIAGQLANISGALRYLNSQESGRHTEDVRSQTATLLTDEAEMLRVSRDPDHAEEKSNKAWRQWSQNLSKLETLFPGEIVRTEIYNCPMHPTNRHLRFLRRRRVVTSCGGDSA